MLKEYLVKTYGYNEPILISEIKLDSLNDNALRQYFKRMVKSGDLATFCRTPGERRKCKLKKAVTENYEEITKNHLFTPLSYETTVSGF